jgi:multiple sugar transport system permease protein
MVVAHSVRLSAVRPGTRVRRLWRRKSTIAFAMALPLLLIVGLLVLYPSLYAFYLATLNKSMERFVGVANFAFLFKRETFWMVVKQSIIFAVSAVLFKALIGLFVAHMVHNVPNRVSASGAGCCSFPG